MSDEDVGSGGEIIIPKEMEELDVLYRRSLILFSCRTVFPFDFFPDSLIIDHNKVDIIYRTFIKTSYSVSIPIARLNHVSVESVAFLSTLEMDVKGYEHNPPPLHYLKTKDAHFAKHLLFGLMSAYAKRIDLSQLSKQDIIAKLIKIGQAT